MKKCVIYGDSISTTNFSAGGYQKNLQDLLFAEEMVNYAENAAAFSSGYPYSVYDKIMESTPLENVDAVIVWAGTNDWYYGVPIGNTDSRIADNFCGCLRKGMLHLSEMYPKAAIIYVSPIYRYSEYEGQTEKYQAFQQKNEIGYTLYDYYKAMKDVSEKTGFILCDMRVLSGINESNHVAFLRDGVHPTVFGYKRIASILSDFLKKYFEIKEI